MRRRNRNDVNDRNGLKESFEENVKAARTESISEDKGEHLGWADDFRKCCYCSLPLLLIYIATLHPSVPGGDSGELIATAHELGVAHPPGYPLFSILSKAFLSLLPFKTPAWRANLVTALFSSISSLFLQLSVLRLTRSFGVSLLIYPLFSLNKVTWHWSVAAEVFSLNNLFITFIITTTIYIESSSSPASSSSSSSSSAARNKICSKACINKLKQLSLMCGLSLTNQHTVVVVVLFVVVWMLYLLYTRDILNTRILLKLFGFFVLGLSPYIYLPVSSLIGQSRCTWGNQGNLIGFLTHLFRREYGTFNLAKSGEGSGLYTMLLLYHHHLQQHMSELTPWLCLVGVVTCVSWAAVKKHLCTLFVTVATMTYLLLFCARCNLNLNNPLFVGVIERFWMQADVGVVMLACVGCHTAIRLVVEKFLGEGRLPLSSVLTTMMSMVMLVLQLKNWRSCDQSGNRVVGEFGMSIMSTMPQHSLVLTRGDLPSNALRYLHIVQNIRPDLQILDVELLSYPWFMPMMAGAYPEVVFPGGRWGLEGGVDGDGVVLFNFKHFLDANIKSRQIFSCIGMQDKDPSWKSTYQVWPYGVCLSIQPITGRYFKLDPAHWANRTQALADKWPHKYDAFHQTSWEKVANDEMWYSKVGTAFHMYKEAMNTTDMHFKAKLLIQAYHLYFRAIKQNQAQRRTNHHDNHPAFWHKNFALVCERLLHVDPLEELDKLRLCKMSIFHLEQYANLEPSNAEADNIGQAVEVLKQRFKYLRNLQKADKSLEKTARRLEKMEKLSSSLQQQQQKQQNQQQKQQRH